MKNPCRKTSDMAVNFVTVSEYSASCIIQNCFFPSLFIAIAWDFLLWRPVEMEKVVFFGVFASYELGSVEFARVREASG